MCSENNISKGLLYHHFKNKDELYLRCVTITFEKLIHELKDVDWESGDVKQKFDRMLVRRQAFFEKNPYEANIFFNAILQPRRICRMIFVPYVKRMMIFVKPIIPVYWI